MSGENVERLRQLYDAWARGDFSAGASLYDPYFVYISEWPRDTDPGPHYGVEAVATYFRRVLNHWESFRFVGTDFREAGDRVIVRVRLAGVGKIGHVPVEAEAFTSGASRRAGYSTRDFRKRT